MVSRRPIADRPRNSTGTVVLVFGVIAGAVLLALCAGDVLLARGAAAQRRGNDPAPAPEAPKPADEHPDRAAAIRLFRPSAQRLWAPPPPQTSPTTEI
jgi:hypothetical protein